MAFQKVLERALEKSDGIYRLLGLIIVLVGLFTEQMFLNNVLNRLQTYIFYNYTK